MIKRDDSLAKNLAPIMGRVATVARAVQIGSKNSSQLTMGMGIRDGRRRP
jgi:hypothetical protein